MSKYGGFVFTFKLAFSYLIWLEITCRPLSIVRDGSIHPPACTAGDVAFGTTCSITCSAGYTRIGPQRKQCLPEGVWTPAEDVAQCLGKYDTWITSFGV